MSSTHVDISQPLIDGIFDVLDGNVTYSGTTYPVEITKSKPAYDNYVYVGQVIHTEEGAKDDFCYTGTVQVRVTTTNHDGEKQLAANIMNVARGLLKTSKGSVFSINPRTLIVFKLESSNELIEGAEGRVQVNLIDVYSFFIE